MHPRVTPTVILGAGAMGVATAYQLALRGEPFVLVEQFALGHDRGSSHGQARIIRHSYADPNYARRMIDAFRAWRELEANLGVPLYLRTGGVSISPEGVDYVDRVADGLASIDVPHLRGSGALWNHRYPMFGLKPDDRVVFEPDAGILLAERAIGLQVERLREWGCPILEGSPVRRIDLEGDRPRLILDDGILEADRLIVAAGAWISRLLPALAVPLRPTRQQVLYFRPEDTPSYSIGRFPVFIVMGPSPAEAYYGMPSLLGRGVKVARHGGPDVDPSADDRAIDPAYVEEVRAFLRRTIPGLADAPIDRTEVCLYTMAEGENFRVGPLPDRPDVIIASPCSGHGFKFSSLIGRILADLSTEGSSSIDTSGWRLA